MKIETIKGIYDSNTYIIETESTCIIVEAGADLQDIKSALNNREPSAIFLTHEHYDHVFHLSNYQDCFDCPIYCHPATLEELRTNKFNTLVGKSFGTPMKHVLRFNNFKQLSDNQIINIGPFEIKAIFAPGHSEGSVVYLINNSLWSGDVLFRTSIGRTDFMPNGEKLMQQTLCKLKEIKFDKMYNGHSEPSTFEQQQKNIARHLNND